MQGISQILCIFIIDYSAKNFKSDGAIQIKNALVEVYDFKDVVYLNDLWQKTKLKKI